MNSLSQKSNTFVPHAMNYFPNSSDENLYYLNNNDAQIRSGYHQQTETTNHRFGYQHQEADNLSNVWTKGNFRSKKISAHELNLNVKASKMSWTSQNNNNNNNNNNDVFEDDVENDVDRQMKKTDEDVEMKSASSPTNDNEATSPSHHARRPMNAFLIFCKKHRPVVRKKYPNLENRGVTRILGEWWALLDTADKDPYKNLAKEYKDAFFSANPDFKWYKLPAPPLRTLSTRPTCTQKEHSPTPNLVNSGSYESEFTPGKLADESQLGMLSSLLNMNNYNKTSSDYELKPNPTLSEIDSVYNNNNNNSTKSPSLESPPSITKTTSLPPKPLKKRMFIEYKLDNKDTSRDVFNVHNKSNADISRGVEDVEVNNVTKQELVDKVVDSMFFPEKNQNSTVPSRNGLMKLAEKETRKSGRSCKGKLYAEFMVNGKLIKNKRDRQQRMSMGCDINTRIETELASKKAETTPKLDLGQTIKRLAERTQINLEEVEQNLEEGGAVKDPRTVSESSYAKNISNKFNLELRISELPSLNYDTYVQRKRESKKRKFTKTKSGGSSECSSNKMSKTQSGGTLAPGDSGSKSLIGSRKRKNKLNITHLEKTHFESSFSDLSGLATLAEIAANTEKINQA